MEQLDNGFISYILENEIEEKLKENKLVNKTNLLRAIRKFTIKNLMMDIESNKKENFIQSGLFDNLLKDGSLWLSNIENYNNDILIRKKEMDIIKEKLESQNLIMVKHTVLLYEKLTKENIEKKYKKIKEKKKSEKNNEKNNDLQHII
jgi:hypothetical protein